MTTEARVPRDAASASRFARITPPSQYTWRYARERYFHALRQNVLVSTATIGAPASRREATRGGGERAAHISRSDETEGAVVRGVVVEPRREIGPRGGRQVELDVI